MSSIEVIIEDLKTHPHCAHGPTVLFSRAVNNVRRRYFACSACRDRKDCSFFLWEDDQHKISESKQRAWKEEQKKLTTGINHRKLFINFNKVMSS